MTSNAGPTPRLVASSGPTPASTPTGPPAPGEKFLKLPLATIIGRWIGVARGSTAQVPNKPGQVGLGPHAQCRRREAPRTKEKSNAHPGDTERAESEAARPRRGRARCVAARYWSP